MARLKRELIGEKQQSTIIVKGLEAELKDIQSEYVSHKVLAIKKIFFEWELNKC
ncbi:hypothetical protein [cyanobacterium endosymbiont of Rhopalodia gibberula]|uniref:hypothetical protein n=1 Tax=cyanobacterium endosymbiont of Rhopalodia gibberula TaxID=1763363 RepID=UPI0015591D7E|nr:hypothetical protein [cyanobacterium endosymbiont of Rhopalodia gibberula]